MRADLSNKPDDYLLCRDQLHRWNDLNVIEEGRLLRIIQVCEVCTGERTQLLSLRERDRGQIIKSWISHYPDNYLLPKGSGRMDRRDRGEIRLHRRGY